MGMIAINDFSTLVANILLRGDIGDVVVIMLVDVSTVVIGAGDTIVFASVVNNGTAVGLVKVKTGVLEAGESLAIANS